MSIFYLFVSFYSIALIRSVIMRTFKFLTLIFPKTAEFVAQAEKFRRRQNSAALPPFFVPNGQLFAECFGAEISFAVREIFVGFLHSAEAQIQQGQINADHNYVGQVAEVPQCAEVKAGDICCHAKGQHQQI